MMQENRIEYSCSKKSFIPWNASDVVKVDVRTHPEVLDTFFTQSLADYEEYMQAVIHGIWEDYAIYQEKHLVSRASVWWCDNQFGEVRCMETLPDYQNRGYCTQLLSYLTKIILEKGNYPTGTTQKDNTVMRHVFEKVGYIREEF